MVRAGAAALRPRPYIRQLSGLWRCASWPPELHPPRPRPWLLAGSNSHPLDIAEQQDRSCETVDAIAREHLEEVDRKIADLQALRRELDSVIGQCRHGRIAECRIIEALAPSPA